MDTEKRIYVHPWHKPETLLEYDPNRRMSRAGEGNYSILSEGVDREYQIIVGRAVFNAWTNLVEPNGLRFGIYVLNTLEKLKEEWGNRENRPNIVKTIERTVDYNYKNVQFPVGDLQTPNDLLVLGVDFGTRVHHNTRNTLDLLMKGVDFVPL